MSTKNKDDPVKAGKKQVDMAQDDSKECRDVVS